MRDHEVSVTADGIAFAETFNVAVPFIDRHLADGRADKIALHAVDTPDGPDVAVTYGELATAVNCAGNAFIGLDLAPGDRIVLVIPDAPEFLYAFWGAIKAGIVPVPVDTLISASDLASVFGDSGCAAVIYAAEFAGTVLHALAEASPAPAYALPVAGEGPTFLSLMEAASDTFEPVATASGDDAFWLYSSDPAGMPKRTVHAQRDLVVSSQRFAVATSGIGPDDVHLSAVRLFVADGSGTAMSVALWAGGTAVLLGGPPTPDSMLALIGRFRPSLYFAGPTLFADHLQAFDASAATPDLASLRACIAVGEPLPPPVRERWQARTGLDIHDGISQP